MPTSPLISVVIPAYQAEKTLGAAISSVLTQTYPKTQIVVCSDGCTDATEDIARAYGERVRLVVQPNSGCGAARNTALRHADGELVALLDADDIWMPHHLEKALAAWRAAGGGRQIVTTNAYFLTSEGIAPHRRVIHQAVPPEEQRMRLLEGPAISIFSVFPRALAEEIGGFDSELRTVEDYDFWLRAVFRGWRIVFQMEPSALYRRTGSSLSADIDQLGEHEQTVMHKLLDSSEVTLSAEERAVVEKRIRLGPAIVHIRRGEQALARGDSRAAAEAFAVASELLPSNRGLRRKTRLSRLPLTAPLLVRAQNRRLRET
ncbi:Glycosyl transferase family 2 [Austwickia chelonae]|uniref:Putative glycosyltransferase n=1 Tax=Austwickia chelonae NBRC 105200 TaxID=1184607 RepID=K6W4G0_9MICO|nr:glycosyltransferase [Austwickia chelonae]GAB76692.1 putative glycosyltransferase [Austwickia chelonae NBRC 105200]SEW29353.1 Glycosyl transferase family 2 [Austwickia chelonae]